jgi:uncharacterized protein (TIGR03435 family)
VATSKAEGAGVCAKTITGVIAPINAYGAKAWQVSGPPWIQSERFDIVAKLPSGSTKEQVPEMLKPLLADRFKMALHHKVREHAVYELQIAKGGPKLKESASEKPRCRRRCRP